MRVLMFGWELPPNNTGGLGVACYGLAKGLASKGIKIDFGMPRKLSDNIDFMDVLDHSTQGVRVTAINSTLQAYASHTDYVSSNYFKHRAFTTKYATTIRDEAINFGEMAKEWSSQKSYNLIHAHDWMTYPAGQVAAKNSDKPWIAHVHATEFDRTGGKANQQIAEIEYNGLTSANQIIAVSNYTKKVIMREYNVSADKISVVHNGVDMDSFRPTVIRDIFPHDKIVLYVGRLTFQKGVEYFLESAKKVLCTHPNTIFIVVGTGDMYQRHILEAASAGIGNRVIFTGFLSGNKLNQVYQMADVFVMPSVSEPYGIVALEAIASGTPTIISNQSGVAETVSHVAKVNFWDTNEISHQIKYILDHPREAQENIALAQVEVQAMNWGQAAHKTLSVYQQFVP